MGLYVCSECGKKCDVHTEIRVKHGRTYCNQCYLTYTTTGDSDTSHYAGNWSIKELEKKHHSLGLIEILISLFLLVIIGTVVFTLLNPDDMRRTSLDWKNKFYHTKNCTETINHSMCFQFKPKYCDDGRIIDRSDICGCDAEFRPYQMGCIQIVNCTDGTLAPDCSINKPYQCLNGTLVEKSSLCGCPDDYAPENDTCKKIERCTADGTIYGKCSRNQPLYCDNGVLVDRASVCGCPEGLVIESIGNTNGEKCVVSRVSTSSSDEPGSFESIYDAETKIHILINAQRAANGQPALNFDERLATIARKHSQDMADRFYFSHDTPEGLGPLCANAARRL